METNKPTDQILVDASDSALGEIAPRTTEVMPLAKLHVLPQIRQEYSQEEIDDLALSMIKTRPDGSKYIFVMNPPWVTWNDRESAQAYLDDVNLYYADQLAGSTLELADFEPDETGRWQFCIAGHRRRQAIIRACNLIGANPAEYPLTVEAIHNVSFDEANSDQGRENNHVRPPERDEAEDIHRYVQYRQAKYGEAVTVADIAKAKGLGVNKVNDALKYAQLPKSIKKAEKEGHFSYTVAVTFGELQRLYRRRANKRGVDAQFDTAEQQALFEIESYYLHVEHAQTERVLDGQQRLTNQSLIKKIEGQKGVVRDDIVLDSLFLDQTDVGAIRPRERRAVILESFAQTTLRAVGLSLDHVPGMQQRIIDALFANMPGEPIAGDALAAEILEN